MERAATRDDRNWLLTIYVVKYAVNHNGSSIFSQFPVSCLRQLNRITWFLPCNSFVWSFSSCAFMFLEYFTPVYLCKVCSVLTSTLKNFVDCTLTGVLYTAHRAVVYNRNVSKGRYLLFFTWKKGKRNPNLTGAFERCILCLYTDRDLTLKSLN